MCPKAKMPDEEVALKPGSITQYVILASKNATPAHSGKLPPTVPMLN